MKHILVLLSIILALFPEVYAEDDKWVDGIRFRSGKDQHKTNFKIDAENYNENGITETNFLFSHISPKEMLPVAIELPETLMNSWSYRGAVIAYSGFEEYKDLPPYGIEDEDLSEDKNFRQTPEVRGLLYNGFFDASDKVFADANPNWALSMDVKSNRIFFGYYWGVFIPAFEYHRFFKFGLGPGIFYSDFSYKVNLCSEYRFTYIQDPEKRDTFNKGKGECVGKTQIDSAAGQVVGLSITANNVFWERYTKDSIWRIGNFSLSIQSKFHKSNVKLTNHDKNLQAAMDSTSIELVSYTYRF
jgi:hypothetical protein